MSNPSNIVYYHNGCMDGLGAAYAVWAALGRDDTVYIPVDYTDTIEPPTHPCVITFVDFCPSREVLEKLLSLPWVTKTQIIDHHASAERLLSEIDHPRLLKVFDMVKSGATLAWETLHGGEPPWLLRHIEDRDLWQFKFDESRPLHAALTARDWTFEQLDDLVRGGNGALARLSVIGTALLEKHSRDVRDILKSNERWMHIAGSNVPVCNAPFTMASDLGHVLCATNRDSPFSAVYWDTAAHRRFSLRSLPEGADVSKIAEQFGGGGHAHAAGFSVPRTNPLAQA